MYTHLDRRNNDDDSITGNYSYLAAVAMRRRLKRPYKVSLRSNVHHVMSSVELADHGVVAARHGGDVVGEHPATVTTRLCVVGMQDQAE